MCQYSSFISVKIFACSYNDNYHCYYYSVNSSVYEEAINSTLHSFLQNLLRLIFLCMSEYH